MNNKCKKKCINEQNLQNLQKYSQDDNITIHILNNDCLKYIFHIFYLDRIRLERVYETVYK